MILSSPLWRTLLTLAVISQSLFVTNAYPAQDLALIEQRAASDYQGEFDSFCSKFTKSCIRTCSKRGRGTMMLACKLPGQSHQPAMYNQFFLLGCKCNRIVFPVDIALEQGTIMMTQTSSFSTKTSLTLVNTQTAWTTLSALTVTSNRLINALTRITAPAIFYTNTSVRSATVTPTTSVTASSTYITNPGSFQVNTQTTTETPQAFVTSTATLQAGGQRRASLPDVKIQQERDLINIPNNFCPAFPAACTAACKGAKSKVDVSVCGEKVNDDLGDLWLLQCVCKDGSDRTTFALNIAAPDDITMTTTLSLTLTSTKLATASTTRTAVATLPAIVKTRNVTITETFTAPAPLITLSTLIMSTRTARAITLPIATTTLTSTMPYAATVTQTTMYTAPTATNTVDALAPIGILRADYPDSSGYGPWGPLREQGDTLFPPWYYGPKDLGTALNLSLVKNDQDAAWSIYRPDDESYLAINSVVSKSYDALGNILSACVTSPLFMSNASEVDLAASGGARFQVELGVVTANSQDPDQAFQVQLTPRIDLGGGIIVYPQFRYWNMYPGYDYTGLLEIAPNDQCNPYSSLTGFALKLLFEPGPTSS